MATGKASVKDIPGVEVSLQPSYQNYVGNTPGHMEQGTLELFLKDLAKPIMAEKELEGDLVIEQCNLVTKGQNSRTRVWRVVVPDHHMDILKDDRMNPSGWHHREFEGHFRPALSPE